MDAIQQLFQHGGRGPSSCLPPRIPGLLQALLDAFDVASIMPTLTTHVSSVASFAAHPPPSHRLVLFLQQSSEVAAQMCGRKTQEVLVSM